MDLIQETIKFIRRQFATDEFIPLHKPYFGGNEKKYLCECIDSTFVSSVGEFVNRFERDIASYTRAKYAVACVNGTNALHIGLKLAGVQPGNEVITQALTFVATGNAIIYSGATPVFVDVDRATLGLSPIALKSFLEKNAEVKNGFSYNKKTGNKIAACMPMHTFGHPCNIKSILDICDNWNIALVEDAAESLGSYCDGRHTGTFGKLAAFSFNGNKTITAGGGGVLITNDESLAIKAKHLTTQAKLPHLYEYKHDEVGYNYRMPNLNAALACAQLEQLDKILENKRQLAKRYKTFFQNTEYLFIEEPRNTKSNYWLNALIFPDKTQRDLFLQKTNQVGVMSRPVWELLYNLPMFKHCSHDGLVNSIWLVDRVVNIPSGYRV